MSFTKPILYYKNALRDAQTGDDGTAYATCTEAVTVDGYPNDIQGDVALSSDISSAATLEGCGITFDATQNKYIITDVQALSSTLESINFLPPGASFGKMLVNGDYLYVLCSMESGALIKINLATMTVSASLHLSVAYPSSLILLGTYGTFLVISGVDGSNVAKFSRVNFSSMTEVQVLSMTTNTTDKKYPTAMHHIGSPKSGTIYVVGRDGSNVAHMFKLDHHDGVLSEITATPHSMNAANLYPTDIVYYSSYFCIACRSSSNVAQVVKATTGGYTSTLTLDAAELYPTALLVSGTNVYVACRNSSNVGILVKTAGGTSRTSALTLEAGELYPSNLILSGTDIFVTCEDGSQNNVLVKTTGTARTSALTLTEFGSNGSSRGALYGSDIIVAGQASAADTSGNVTKVTTGTVESTILQFSQGEQNPTAVLVSGNNVFVACETNAGRANIVLINAATRTKISNLVLNAGELYPTAMLEFGSDIFIACRNASNVGVLVRTNQGTTRTDALTLDAAELYPTDLLLYGTDIFVLCRDSTDIAVLVRTAEGISRTDALTLLSTGGKEKFPTAMLNYGTDIFVACRNTSDVGVIVQTDAGISRTGALTLEAGESFPTALLLSGSDIFCACRNGSNVGVIVKIAGGTSRTSALTLDAAELYPTDMILYLNYITVLCRNASNVAVMVKTTGTARVDATTLTSALYGKAMGLASGSIYAAGQNVSTIGVVYMVKPIPIFSVFERIQDADRGGSFTIRAALVCAQASETRPAVLVADNHMHPRFVGTVNTEHKIRVHAPNFITDGGFGSGAFSPNWTAGANWSITTSNKLEGAYSAAWDCGANNSLVQTITKKLVKGKTYRVVLKTKAITGNAAAGCLTISPKAATSGTAVYGAISGNTIAPTTTATWTEFDIVPDFSTSTWELHIIPATANKGSATVIVVDEIYLYEKRTIDTLIVGGHNWGGKGTIKVNAWRLSPLRSTSGSDANNKTEIASFSVNTSEVIQQALTTSYYPVLEIVLPAVAAWTPEAGEIYLGPAQSLPRFPERFDPYGTNQEGLRELSVKIENLSAAYRLGFIEDIYEKLRDSEAVWWKWNTDDPLLMESPRSARKSSYDPDRVELDLKLVERL